MIRIDIEKCKYNENNCSICVDICSRNALRKEDTIVVDASKCNSCYLCVTACIHDAIGFK